MTLTAARFEAAIRQARAVRIEGEIARRGGTLTKAGKWEWFGPCPKCGGTDRFSINIDKQVFNCRGCQLGGDVIALVMHVDGLDFLEAVEALTDVRTKANDAHVHHLKPAANVRHGEHLKSDNIPLALAIWNEARDPAGTPVIAYLQHRRVILPPRCEAIRFHPRCPFGKDANGVTIYTPAMVALVTSILTNEPQGIHRTALNGKAGHKRMSLGRVPGGAVKLTPDEDVTIALGIGEGIETTLSLPQRPEWQLRIFPCSPASRR
jgi:hypothetical protein